MSVYAIDVPELNTIDALAEQRERRDERTRARMSRKAYKDAILATPCQDLLYISGDFRRLYPVGTNAKSMSCWTENTRRAERFGDWG
jgi:hypothetical protein